MIYPICNAIPLCSDCHQWLDSHFISEVLLDPDKRVLSYREESYTFIVTKLNYSWEDLLRLKVMSNKLISRKCAEEQAKIELKEILKEMKGK